MRPDPSTPDASAHPPPRRVRGRRLDPAALARWLAAERADPAAERDGPAAAAAAAALRELLGALPPLAPPAGFAQRVMARAALAPRVAGAAIGARRPARRPWASPWLRAAVLLCVASGGFALLWARLVLHSLVDVWSPAELLEKSVAGLLSLHLWLASTIGIGQKLVLLCKAFSAPLAIAPFVVVAVVCLLISGAAFRVLRALIHSDRRWVYVDPI